jgi:3-oxoacyl-[acyl-carrier-protein] synthase III
VTSVGILGVGRYVPSEVRTNDWWPAATVQRWMAERPRPQPPKIDGLGEGARRVIAAMSRQALDPFQGAVERHVMGTETAFDMGERAARAALERAGIDVGDVDLLLTHTVVPDVLLGNPACELHKRLGLREACFAMETDASTYAFLAQLSIADAMITSGKARTALLVQSSGTSPLVDYTDPTSVVFGDGATAVVVGPVRDGRGIRGAAHFADGNFPSPLVASVPGGRWFDAGRARMVVDWTQMNALLIHIADVLKKSVDAALANTGIRPEDIKFFCMHQGTPWLRTVVEEYCGLVNARSTETFAKTGYLFGAILPMGLYEAELQGLLADGDLVMLAAGGAGMTYGATVLEWGR